MDRGVFLWFGSICFWVLYVAVFGLANLTLLPCSKSIISGFRQGARRDVFLACLCDGIYCMEGACCHAADVAGSPLS